MNPFRFRFEQRAPLRLWLAIAIFIAAILLLLGAAFPLATIQQEIRFPPVYLPTPTALPQGSGALTFLDPAVTPMPSLLEKRLIILNWPQKMREEDTALIDLAIKMDPERLPAESIPVGLPNIYSTHNIVAVARLDMAGVEASREEIQESLLPGRVTTFHWRIRAGESGNYRGVVWLHLDLVPRNGGPYERILLLARPIEIETVSVFGLSGSMARRIGLVGLVLGILLGYPFIQEALKNWVQKRRKVSQSEPAEKAKVEKEKSRSPE